MITLREFLEVLISCTEREKSELGGPNWEQITEDAKELLKEITMNICDICKDVDKKANTFVFNYKFINTFTDELPKLEREGGTTIDLCNQCILLVKGCNLVEIISKGMNESKLQGILDHFKQSAQMTYTKENIIQTIEKDFRTFTDK